MRDLYITVTGFFDRGFDGFVKMLPTKEYRGEQFDSGSCPCGNVWIVAVLILVFAF